VLGIGRRKNRSRLVKDELNESLEHLRQAASHAADGVNTTVAPRIGAARAYVAPATGRMRKTASRGWDTTVATLTPLAAAAVVGARKAKAKNLKAMKKQEPPRARRRLPRLAGLLAAGTAVGAAGALVMRRRRQQQWDEYDPSQALESMRSDTASMIDTTRNKVEGAMDSTAARAQAKADKVGAGAEQAADRVSSTTDRMADKTAASTEAVKEKTSSMADSAKRQTDKAVNKGEDLVGKAGMPSRNSRS
jgi:cytoskeletal protein RodZ